MSIEANGVTYETDEEGYLSTSPNGTRMSPRSSRNRKTSR
jgi:hypothetical protein